MIKNNDFASFSSSSFLGLKVAVVGATGAVGKELLSILEKRKFPIHELILFGSKRSLGKTLQWKDKFYPCRALEKDCFNGVDLAFFDASDAVSKEWVEQASRSGAWVIDNSATFRLQEDVLLLVPEVNGLLLEERIKRSNQDYSVRERILSGPNCSTVQMVVALKPIQENWGIKRIVVSTYQSTSGAGAQAMMELSSQTFGIFNQKDVRPEIFPHQIAFNCIPHIGSFKEDGNTSEELKMIQECRKLLGVPDLKISATAVRVPTFSCHAESINVECEKPFEIQEVRDALQKQPGILLCDDPSKNIYPLGVGLGEDRAIAATGQDAVYVGRIRKDPSIKYGLNLWVVSDNLRKGAALNAVQMGEILHKNLFSVRHPS